MNKQKLLIVDDKEENLFSLERILAPIQNLEIIKTTKPEAALRLCLEHDFSLAILDVQMPGMDGYELAELLRGTEKTEKLPIIFLSAMSVQDHHVARGYEIGANDYIVKPVRAEVIIAKVKVFLELDAGRRNLQQLVEARTRELAESEARFRSSFESAAIGKALVSLEGRFIDANTALCQLVGYPHDELIQKTFQDITYPDDLEKDLAYVNELIEGKRHTYQMNKRYVHRDGHMVWTQLNVATVKDAEGCVLYFIAQIQDITDRMNTQNSLREAVELFRSTFESAAIGMALVSLEGRFVDTNTALCQIVGYPHDELIQKTFHDITYPDDLETDLAYVNELLEGTRDSYQMDKRYIHKDGHIVWIQLAGATVKDAEGKLLYFIAQIQDITERKKAQEALRLSEERLALAVSASQVGIWDWDIVNNDLVWDDSMFELYGVRRDKFSGAYEAWQKSLHPQDVEKSDKAINDALAGIRPFDLEFRACRSDGKIRYIRGIAEVFRDEKHRPIRMIGTNWDVTEQKQAAARIEKLLEFNETIITESTLGIVVFKATGECTLCNPAAARIIGSTSQEQIARNFHQIDSWKSSGMLSAALRALETMSSQHVDAHVVSSYGRERWLNCDFIPLQKGDEPKLLMIMGDVSEFKMAEQALSNARLEAERANQAKSEFLANMSHEIRTPMNAIIGLSDLALEIEGHEPKLQTYLSKIASSSKALLSILNDILDYSKVEAGRLELDLSEFSLNDVLQNAIDLFEVHASEKGLELTLDVAPDVAQHLIGDSVRLSQVLNNLIGNALKFTEQGKVCVRIKQMAKDEQSSTLLFSVQDTGIGMSEEQVLRLFNPFTQADSTITRRFGGSGLGLSISQRLVEKMGGEIRVESELGKGSIFKFTISLTVCDQANVEPKSPQPRSRPESVMKGDLHSIEGAHVLLVEDDTTNQLVAKHLLNGMGLAVTLASDGRNALDELQNTHFDAVLMDLHMPGMGGLEATQHIRRESRWASLPIIAMTAAVFDDDRAACEDAGMNDFVSKPIRRPELATALLKWIQLNADSSNNDANIVKADSSMVQIPECLPGFDLDITMKRIGFDYAFLRDLLKKFAPDLDGVELELADHLTAHDLNSAAFLMHRIKGSAANVGASQLAEEARLIEEAIRNGVETVDANNFYKSLDQVRDSLVMMDRMGTAVRSPQQEPSSMSRNPAKPNFPNLPEKGMP